MMKERPLSPHLQVYNMLQMTSLLSMTHRGTGAYLAISTPVLVWWLWTIAAGPGAYAEMQAHFAHWFCKLLLLSWSFSLFYHLCNGIRHLFWDVGHGYEMKTLYASGRMMVLTSVVLTGVTWLLALQRLGGA